MLRGVAANIASCVRSMDVAARYGGEEFCVLLDDSDLEEAFSVAERIRKLIESSITEYEGERLQVTISCGVAMYDPDLDISAKSLIDRADRALYVSKQTGRNKVSIDRPEKIKDTEAP